MIDLRSDTVTRPTAGMRAAMAEAEVGDDVYGEDPTCQELEERVAELLGQPAALFTVSGSLANRLGVATLVEHGQELLCESSAHVVRAEHGSHAALSGVTTRTWRHARGLADVGVIEAMISPPGLPMVPTAAIAVENTHNFGGGAIQPLERLRALRELATRHGLGLHLDGARLWNAAAASGVELAEYGRLFDTVSVCLSKGLGAPVGSLVAGSVERIAQARRLRARSGGAWRQAGMLAAAGLYALDQHRDRLAVDHANARELARTLAAARPGVIDPDTVETNICVLDLTDTGQRADELASAARAEGVLVGALGPSVVRLVTHLDVSTEQCRRAGEVLAKLLSG